MRIDFFEEFPDEKNLSMARLINFPSTIFLAAKSLKKYDEYCQVLRTYNMNLDTVFWPILEKSYWLSNFSFPSEIDGLTKDIIAYSSKSSLKILLDLELPIIHPAIFFRSFYNFSKSRQSILKLFATLKIFKIPTFTAEYLFTSLTLKSVWNKLGVSYKQSYFSHSVISMAYTSNLVDRIFFKKFLKTFGQNYNKINHRYVGVGAIAKGVFEYEPILSVSNLDKVLNDLQRAGVENIVVFRLGGLNPSYLSILQKYV